MQWASKRARGRAGDDEFDGDDDRSPKRGTATWRRCRASGELWVGGEGRGGRGGAPELVGGARGGRRWLLWRTAATVVFGRVRERARERRGEPRESEREQGEGVASSGASSEEGRAGRQGERWRGAVARARAGHTPLPLSGRRRQRREAGWAACWLGRPAGWAAQGGAQVSFSLLFFFLFSNF